MTSKTFKTQEEMMKDLNPEELRKKVEEECSKYALVEKRDLDDVKRDVRDLWRNQMLQNKELRELREELEFKNRVISKLAEKYREVDSKIDKLASVTPKEF